MDFLDKRKIFYENVVSAFNDVASDGLYDFIINQMIENGIDLTESEIVELYRSISIELKSWSSTC